MVVDHKYVAYIDRPWGIN